MSIEATRAQLPPHAASRATRLLLLSELEYDSDTGSEGDVWNYETVEYNFLPSAAVCSREIFARERHVEKMRQREIAAIRRLDGDALMKHSQKRMMAREAREMR